MGLRVPQEALEVTIGGLQLEPNNFRKFSASEGQVRVHAGAKASTDMVAAPGAHWSCAGASLARLEKSSKTARTLGYGPADSC